MKSPSESSVKPGLGHLIKRSPRRREFGGISVEYISILVLVCILGVSAWKSYKEAVKDDVEARHTEFGYMR